MHWSGGGWGRRGATWRPAAWTAAAPRPRPAAVTVCCASGRVRPLHARASALAGDSGSACRSGQTAVLHCGGGIDACPGRPLWSSRLVPQGQGPAAEASSSPPPSARARHPRCGAGGLSLSRSLGNFNLRAGERALLPLPDIKQASAAAGVRGGGGGARHSGLGGAAAAEGGHSVQRLPQ